MPDTPKSEDFLSRWSRKKREPDDSKPESFHAEPESFEENLPPERAEPAPHAPESDDELTDAELLEKYELPDPDTMISGDNFSAFMKKSVPDRLRRRALRVLWGSNPILANLDELVDYGEDYTDAATVVENMQTIYQVGKGAAWKFKEEQERLAALAAAEEAEAAERRAHNGEPEEDDLALAPDDPEDLPEPDDAEPEPEPELAALTEDDLPPPLPPRPRPMRFEFD